MGIPLVKINPTWKTQPNFKILHIENWIVCGIKTYAFTPMILTMNSPFHNTYEHHMAYL